MNNAIYKDILTLIFGNSENARYFKKYYSKTDNYKLMKDDYLKFTAKNTQILSDNSKALEPDDEQSENAQIKISTLRIEEPEIVEPVTLERLMQYANVLNDYREIVREKSTIMRSVGVLKSKDYSRDRVTSSNDIKTSIQERYAIKLERINKQITEYRAWILPEQRIIKAAINKLPKLRYKQLLIMRYIYRFKWVRIREEFFCFEPDFEEQKNDKYKDKTFVWHRAALAALEKSTTNTNKNIQGEHAST